MKNKFILLLIILMILIGAGLLELNLWYLGGTFLSIGILLFILFPLVCDFINNN